MRIKYIDNTRAFCMIWIVAIWHLADYCNVSINSAIAQSVTYGVLGAFTFLSGMMLSRNKINTPKDALMFYKKRLLRIYPLFAIACTSMYILYVIWNVQLISGLKQYLFTMIGLSSFVSPTPGTIWYIGMLLLFYAFTPLLLFNCGSRSRLVIIKGIVLEVIFVCLYISHIISVDERLLFMFPVYTMGLYVGIATNNEITFSILRLVVCAGAFVVLAFFSDNVWAQHILIKIVYIEIMMMVFIDFLLQVGKGTPSVFARLLKEISYSSFCAYLFHRQIYGVMSKILGTFSIIEAVISFLLVIVVSYLIQFSYDYLLRLLEKGIKDAKCV